MQFVYMCYFAERLTCPSSEGTVAGDCFEALWSMDERASEYARKGFRARAVGLWSKRLAMRQVFVYTFSFDVYADMNKKRTFATR